MTFVHPSFLWALAAVTIPVIIHLFNFRRYKKVYFTNVKFLREIQEESKSRSRLRELLVLLARCLAISCLVLAFCQPIIPAKNGGKISGGPGAFSIYIDNSFSTQNVNADGPVFEVARQKARELIRTSDGSVKFQVITNDFEGRHQRLLTREDALAVIEDIKVSPAVRKLTDVIKRQSEFLAGNTIKNKRLLAFSDAQRSTFNVEELKPDSLLPITLVPVNANQVNNVYIDSCWFETPVQQKGFIQNLHARVRNLGNGRIDIASAKLFINSQQTAIASFSIEPGQFTEVKFTFECGIQGFNFCSIKIEDYPVTFDDEFYFSFNSMPSIGVCLVHGKDQEVPGPLGSLFASDSVFNLKQCSENTIDYSLFGSADVLVLNQLSTLSSGLVSELTKFCRQGGALVILPSFKSDVQGYNIGLSALGLPLLGKVDTALIKAGKLETTSDFFQGVFEKTDDRMNLPVAAWHYALNREKRIDFENIMTFNSGETFFGFAKSQNTRVFLFSTGLSDKAGNFNKHALFVPTFYKICFGAVKVAPLFYPVSSNVVVQLKGSGAQEQPPHIRRRDGNVDIIPEIRTIDNALFLHTRSQINEPGFYEITLANAPLVPLAFNYSRLESDLTSYTANDLEKIIADKGWKQVNFVEEKNIGLAGDVSEINGGKKLWKLFILLALGFVLAETALLRLLK